VGGPLVALVAPAGAFGMPFVDYRGRPPGTTQDAAHLGRAQHPPLVGTIVVLLLGPPLAFLASLVLSRAAPLIRLVSVDPIGGSA
jgi:hypothetical protein